MSVTQKSAPQMEWNLKFNVLFFFTFELEMLELDLWLRYGKEKYMSVSRKCVIFKPSGSGGSIVKALGYCA